MSAGPYADGRPGPAPVLWPPPRPWLPAPAALDGLPDRDLDRCTAAAALGIDTLLTPFRAPRANALAERVVRTLRQECLDHVLVLNERHLAEVLQEYVAYYNTERPHRSLGLAPPLPGAPPLRSSNGPPAQIVARPVLGGLHHVYRRAA